MKRSGRFLVAGASGLFALLLTVTIASAQSEDIDKQIKALENEVAKIEPLKDQIEKLREQQIELKKEATAAAAELPTFQYRPGRGLTIAAADKSWSFNTTYRMNLYNYNIINGKSNFADGTTQVNSGTTSLELFPRRNRIYFNYCWTDCFYAMEYSIDGETADPQRMAAVRDNEFIVHFDQLNPYFPYFSIGTRRGAGKTHISRSSDNDGKMEHSVVLEGFQWGGDGSHSGAGLGWEGVDIGPGELDLFLNWATSRQGTWQEFRQNDTTGIMAYIGGRPFANLKNKWISGLEIGFGYQGQSLDRPQNEVDTDSAVNIRVRNVERRGRVDLFRPGNLQGGDQNVGSGWGQVFIPGVKWVVGPYMTRGVYVNTRYKSVDPGNGRGVWGTGWTWDHQLMVWSPKGFLTGSQTTPNTVMISFGFERGVMDCGVGCDASPNTGSFHHQQITNREWALWYWLQPSLGVGMWSHWWTTTNTPVRTQVAVGCKDNIASAKAGKGASRGCDFYSVNSGLRFRW